MLIEAPKVGQTLKEPPTLDQTLLEAPTVGQNAERTTYGRSDTVEAPTVSQKIVEEPKTLHVKSGYGMGTIKGGNRKGWTRLEERRKSE